MPDQLGYQRAAYDDHYPKMAAAVREQLAHPLLCSFYDRLAALILDGLPAGGHRVLEAGCGEGLVASAVQRVARARRIDVAFTGTDLSAAGIELARTVVEGTFVEGDAVEVVAGMAAASQHLVWAKNLLHHLEDPATFLREAMRVVGPGGRVVIVEPRMWCPVHWVNLMWFRQERFLFRGYRRNAAAFAAAGASILSTTEFGWLPYELALATRFRAPRRLLSMGPGPALDRITAVDDRLTATLPDLALYMVTVVRGR
ncbi:MAG TPA: class I SAM-dependent methyltransferase [Acidimicrobiales bacterium]|nr:class I SAM-dependent methyltransferase [Acidimicrobiales bacterium]